MVLARTPTAWPTVTLRKKHPYPANKGPRKKGPGRDRKTGVGEIDARGAAEIGQRGGGERDCLPPPYGRARWKFRLPCVNLARGGSKLFIFAQRQTDRWFTND